MAIVEISVSDTGVVALLAKLTEGAINAEPAMRAIGEYIMELSKESFEKGTDFDGRPWASNSLATIMNYLGQTSGNFEDGKLTAKGAARAANKRPLIGLTRGLARNWHYDADGQSVSVFNTEPGARMQNFGGLKALYPHLWGDIPQRQFAPINRDGDLEALAATWATQAVQDYIDNLIGG